jgi:hypothetical protein
VVVLVTIRDLTDLRLHTEVAGILIEVVPIVDDHTDPISTMMVKSTLVIALLCTE